MKLIQQDRPESLSVQCKTSRQLSDVYCFSYSSSSHSFRECFQIANRKTPARQKRCCFSSSSSFFLVVRVCWCVFLFLLLLRLRLDHIRNNCNDTTTYSFDRWSEFELCRSANELAETTRNSVLEIKVSKRREDVSFSLRFFSWRVRWLAPTPISITSSRNKLENDRREKKVNVSHRFVKMIEYAREVRFPGLQQNSFAQPMKSVWVIDRVKCSLYLTKEKAMWQACLIVHLIDVSNGEQEKHQ